MPAPTVEGQWIRASRVGASEVGALMGHHPFVTAGDIWARLQGHEERRRSTQAMQIGNDLEPAVAALWSVHAARKVVRCSRTYAHRSVRLCATPDYYVPASELLEVKVSGDWDMWRDLPEHVEWQTRAQMACTGRMRCHVAVLLGGTLRTFTVQRDLDAERQMLETVAAFVEAFVDSGTPPPDADPELVFRVRPAVAGVVAATDDIDAAAQELMEVIAVRKAIEDREKELRKVLVTHMAERRADGLLGAGWTMTTDARGALRFQGGNK